MEGCCEVIMASRLKRPWVRSLVSAGAVAALVGFTSTPLDAQLFYVGVRAGAGIPTGTFADSAQGSLQTDLLAGATPGLGYGLDAGVGLGPLLGAYASFDRIAFGCGKNSCATSGKYTLTGYSAGVRAGVPLLPLLKPWVKAGITLNEIEGRIGESSNATRVTTKRAPGYEIGAGFDIPILGGFFNLTPQARRIRQKLEYDVPSPSVPTPGKKSVDYYTFDIGIRLRSPI